MLGLLASLLAMQPTGGDLVVNLCNETPVTVAYTVSYTSGAGLDIQRGWFNVPPRDCLNGRIGATSGGLAYVHVRSGTFEWPASDSPGRLQAWCVPPASHESPARVPPCNSSTREASHIPVGLERSGRQYRLDYTVTCEGLGDDAGLCRSSRPGRDGFAQPVRELRVCNIRDVDVLVGELSGLPRSTATVANWHEIQAGQCRAVFRDMREPGSYYFLTPLADIQGGEFFSSSSEAYCVSLGEAGLPEDSARQATGPSCPVDSVPYILRTAEFGRMTSQFEITVN